MPRRPRSVPRVQAFETAELLEPSTRRLHDTATQVFVAWLVENGIKVLLPALLAAPVILDRLLRQFGIKLYKAGCPLYMYLHTLAALQNMEPSLKGNLHWGWNVASVWEEMEPSAHRIPIPERLFEAMMVVALQRGWRRWAAVTAIAFCGIGRPGEPLFAVRSALVLPSDVLGASEGQAFLLVAAPKGRRRGVGRVQHLTIPKGPVVGLLEAAFLSLAPTDPLYPFSRQAYRSRWDHILRTLKVPESSGFVPGGLRGGGCVASYYRGASVAELLWRMRLKNLATLSAYLQEVAALTSLIHLPPQSREAIALASNFFLPFLRASSALGGFEQRLS